MHKNIIKAVAVLGVVTGGMAGAFSNVSAVHNEERIRVTPNTVDEVMITKIVPANGATRAIELTYRNIDPIYSENNGWPREVTIGYGDFSDKDLYRLSFRAFNNGIYGSTKVSFFQAEEYIGNDTVWESGRTVRVSGLGINRNADLIDASEGRMAYKIFFAGSEEAIIGRIDYSRCIHSSVFINGEATECWLEEIGDGKIQYQPYTSDGVRVEIPPEEDAALTAATEAWDPLYGWPNLEPEPGVVEPEPGVVEPEPEPEPELEPGVVEPGVGPGTVEPEPEVGPEVVDPGVVSDAAEPKPEVDPEVIVSNPEVAQGVIEPILEVVAEMAGFKNGETEVVENGPVNSEKEIKMTEVTTEVTAGVAMEADGGTQNGGTPGGSADQGNTLETTGGAKQSDVVGVAEKSGSDRVTEVIEVPELGQGTDKKPNIALAAVLIAGTGAALFAIWWLLFFGGRKRKERKEGKE